MMSPAVLQGPISAASATTIFTTDVSDRDSISVQLTAIGTSNTVSFECSLDGANWALCTGYSMQNQAAITSGTTVGLYLFDVTCVQKFRARVSTYTSGTVTALWVSEAGAQALPRTVNVGAGALTVSSVTASPSNNSVGTPFRWAAAATTNSNLVKGSAGRIVGGHIANVSAATKYVKFYNKATAPTVGTDTPYFIMALPPNYAIGISDIVDIYGLYFTAGIGFGITGGAADADVTATAAGDVILTLLYS